jgi:tetratricopeptide (TPR) repeat protein
MTPTPNIFAFIALIGMVPFALFLFTLMPAPRAVVTSAIGAWLFLPATGIRLPGIPDYGKATAAVAGILLGTLVFEPNRLMAFRLRWFDLPMLLWSLCPFASSISNELGIYDGLSATLVQTTTWFLPYFIGRLYFTDAESLRELVLGMIVGGLCLIPLCIFEIKMSPQLQQKLYGFGAWEGTRYGGYRPRVFFSSSLELGLWMNAVTLVAWWLWRTGQLKRLGGLGSPAVVTALLITSIACKTTTAILLFSAGAAALWISWRTKTKWALCGLLAIAPIYYVVRITDTWSGKQAVELARLLINNERAQSLGYRLDNEDLLIAKALQRPYFGQGGWGRNLVYEPDTDRQLSIIDGMWVIALGVTGCVGLVLMATAMLLPGVLFLKRFPVAQWDHPSLAAAVAVAVIVDLYMLDGLFNGMINVVYVIAAGGLLNITPASIWSRGRPIAWSSNSRERLAVQYRSLGRSLKDQGRFSEAKTAWLHALKLLTEQTTVRSAVLARRQQWCDCANDLAWFLVNVPDPAVQDANLAVSLALTAAQACPECSTYWNTLGAVHYRVGAFKAAVAALDQATVLTRGGTAFDHFFLAMAHMRLGDQEQARHSFAQAMCCMEQHQAGHAELRRLCDEAKSTLIAVPETLTPLIDAT